MRAVDDEARGAVGLDRLVERAGTAVALAALSILGGAYGRRVTVVAGPGNNGSDGRVAARLLARRGARVELLDVGASAVRPDADLVVDAAFGTGFHGTYEPPAAPASAVVLAVDVPSGLDALTGIDNSSPFMKAALTVTFGALKPGLLFGSGPERCGVVRVAPIGLPVEAGGSSIALMEDADVAALLPARQREDHKWTSALAVVAGSPGMLGAARLSSEGAMRAGAGMVRLGVPGAAAEALPSSEAVATALSGEDFDNEVSGELGRVRALVVGPGLGRADATTSAVRRLVAAAGVVPTVVDADGLFALGTAEAAAATIARRSGPGGGPRGGGTVAAPVVLTPHDGELARLAGKAPGGDRVEAARSLAGLTGAIVLLKGPTTVICHPSGAVLLSASGSPALATAGSGDVLSGVIGAFAARGVPLFEAAALAAHVHGRAAERGPGTGLVSGDLPRLVSDALSELGCG